MAVEGRFGTLSVATRSQRSRRQAMEFSMSRHYRPTEHGLTEATVSGTNSSRVLHRNVSHQQRCAPAKDRAQPGEVRGARVLEVAKGAGLDRRAGRAVATNRAKAVPGDGLDARANRRLPRRGGSPPTLPSLASHRSPRAAPQSGSSPAVGRRRSRRRPGHRAGAVRRKGPVSPKSESGNRTIALDALTVAVLRAQRDAQDAERRLRGEGWGGWGRVFTKEDRSTLNPDSFSQRFDRLLARHDLPPIRLHDLRHGTATLALAAGAGVKVVSHELGHSSIQITQDLYTSALPQVSKAAADAVAALLAGSRQATDQADAQGPSGQVAGRLAHTSHTRGDETDSRLVGGMDMTAGQSGWGGWGSNPRPKDYESSALTD